jgi:hypothetical protein
MSYGYITMHGQQIIKCDLICRDIRDFAGWNIDGGVLKWKPLRKLKRIRDEKYFRRITVTVTTKVVILFNEI